jgi:hypothetical protein
MDEVLDMDDLLERLDPDVYLDGAHMDVMPCPRNHPPMSVV